MCRYINIKMSLTITDHVFCCVPAGSNDSSQYFGSVDSSQTSQKANGQSNDGETRAIEGVQSEHFNKYVPHRVFTHIAIILNLVCLLPSSSLGIERREYQYLFNPC